MDRPDSCIRDGEAEVTSLRSHRESIAKLGIGLSSLDPHSGALSVFLHEVPWDLPGRWGGAQWTHLEEVHQSLQMQMPGAVVTVPSKLKVLSFTGNHRGEQLLGLP